MPNQAEAVSRLIHEHGPLDLIALHALARAEGVTTARTTDTIRSAVRYAPGVVTLPDGTFLSTAALLAGATLTTRWRGGRPGVLFAGRDLQPFLELLGREGLPLTSGGRLHRGEALVGSLVGPAGWLPEVAVGELIQVTWDGEALTVGAGQDVPDGTSAQAQSVREVLAEHGAPATSTLRRPSYGYGSGYGSGYGWAEPPARSAVVDALIAVPDLFDRPVPPLSELLPLPPELQRVQDTWGDDWRTDPPVQTIAVPVSARVLDELERRADLIGERMPDYAAQLLTVAADRLLPVPPSSSWGGYEEPPYRSRPLHAGDDSVVSGPWGR
jgi:hypothetical protein